MVRLLRPIVLVLILAGGALAASPGPSGTPYPPQAPAQQPAFRAGVDVVSLSITVTGRDGRFVTDLDSGAFGIYEDGVKQDISYFNRSNLPLALSLLLDTSASMEGKLATAQEAAVGFARRTRPVDLAEVIDFDTKVEVIQSFTREPDSLERAIRRTTAGGSTALFNAVYIALKELKKTRPTSAEEARRQAIILLSDGEDTSSLVSFDEVLDLARRSETAVYAIGLRSKDEPVTRGFREADFVLRELSQQTGGRAFFSSRIEELAGVYDQIADELSSQYLVGYVARNGRRDGSWRRVVVRVDREGLITRTKLGYYAPGPR